MGNGNTEEVLGWYLFEIQEFGDPPQNDKINEPETVVKVPSRGLSRYPGVLARAESRRSLSRMGGAERQCQFIRQEQG